MSDIATFAPAYSAVVVKTASGSPMPTPKPVIVIAMVGTNQVMICIDGDGVPVTCSLMQLNFDVRYDAAEGRWTDTSTDEDTSEGA